MLSNTLIIAAALAPAALAYCDLGTPQNPVDRRQGAPVHVANFSYVGETGPLNWANLPGWADNSACAIGKRQSPINIDSSISAGPAPTISYKNGLTYRLDNIGSTIEGFPPANPGSITLAGRTSTYNLANFHFHTPSEHRFDSEYFPLEMHIVNSNGTNNVVLTVMFNVSRTADPFLHQVLANKGAVAGPGGRTDVRVDFTSIVNHINSSPRKFYGGSLTVPPCTENTEFIIAQNPLNISRSQYNFFRAAMDFNSRYTQNSLGRVNLLQLPQPSK